MSLILNCLFYIWEGLKYQLTDWLRSSSRTAVVNMVNSRKALRHYRGMGLVQSQVDPPIGGRGLNEWAGFRIRVGCSRRALGGRSLPDVGIGHGVGEEVRSETLDWTLDVHFPQGAIAVAVVNV